MINRKKGFGKKEKSVLENMKKGFWKKGKKCFGKHEKRVLEKRKKVFWKT